MSTINDIVTNAFRLIRVVADDEPMSPDQADNGLKALNAMVHGWALKGVDVGHSDWELSDSFTLAPEFEEATTHLLGARLAPQYRGSVEFNPNEFWSDIAGAHQDIPETILPTALTNLPSKYMRTARSRNS